MCGIVGVWNRRSGERADASVLQNMQSSLRHRGPDDAGVYTDHAIALGHRRLAILDRSPLGHQPMTTPDGRHTIVFNGEIYNFSELRTRPGVPEKLRSTSDTEVLLHLLASEGESALPLLRGMFAFALWDAERRTLLLARDAFGKKPLYYAETDDAFLFASEPKALLAHPAVTTEIDPIALPKYFLYEYVPAPATMYRDIRQLPMGHVLEVTASTVRESVWWKPTFMPKIQMRDADALTTLDRALDTAVQRRMIADVPVGAFLSGGLDSAAITWYMRQHATGELHTFSVSFHEASFDESSHARSAARALGTTHHELLFSVEQFHKTLESVLPLFDEPLGDASLLPTYAVSALARPFITVALDGDGSDELFGGYGTFPAAELAERLYRLSPRVGSALETLSRLLPTRYENFTRDFIVKSFVKGLPYDLPRRNQVWLGSFSDRELPRLLTPTWQRASDELFADIDRARGALAGLPAFDAVSLLTIIHYLQNDLLLKLDRATMAMALEARTPFLDLDLAEFALRLPPEMKRGKRLLKQLMRGRLPDAIIERPKKGFGIPLGAWLRGPLREFLKITLAEDTLRADGFFQPQEVWRLIREHLRGVADHRKKLWTLIMFQLWFQRRAAGRSV